MFSINEVSKCRNDILKNITSNSILTEKDKTEIKNILKIRYRNQKNPDKNNDIVNDENDESYWRKNFYFSLNKFRLNYLIPQALIEKMKNIKNFIYITGTLNVNFNKDNKKKIFSKEYQIKDIPDYNLIIEFKKDIKWIITFLNVRYNNENIGHSMFLMIHLQNPLKLIDNKIKTKINKKKLLYIEIYDSNGFESIFLQPIKDLFINIFPNYILNFIEPFDFCPESINETGYCKIYSFIYFYFRCSCLNELNVCQLYIEETNIIKENFQNKPENLVKIFVNFLWKTIIQINILKFFKLKPINLWESINCFEKIKNDKKNLKKFFKLKENEKTNKYIQSVLVFNKFIEFQNQPSKKWISKTEFIENEWIIFFLKYQKIFNNLCKI